MKRILGLEGKFTLIIKKYSNLLLKLNFYLYYRSDKKYFLNYKEYNINFFEISKTYL